jgi:hypothetical protein
MKKTPIIITALVLILGIGAFLLFRPEPVMSSSRLYQGMEIKTNYLDGTIKLFALANNNALSRYAVEEGKVLPLDNEIVLGNIEAAMMKKEGLIEGRGSAIDGFFGIDITVGGILAKNDSPIDDMHFLSRTAFDAINGEENRVYVQLLEGMPKMFYRLEYGEEPQMELPVAEGSADNYAEAIINGTAYYPIMIGAAEAKMMRNESLFTQPGDTIRGFFGKDVIIVAVLDETGTALDMMHIVPFEKNEW